MFLCYEQLDTKLFCTVAIIYAIIMRQLQNICTKVNMKHNLAKQIQRNNKEYVYYLLSIGTQTGRDWTAEGSRVRVPVESRIFLLQVV
jgi:hypothetical protein